MRPNGLPPGAVSPERDALLDSLRRRIARGEYRIPAEAVADAVLRAWTRPGPGDAGSRSKSTRAQAG
jgi:hypothetical protein